MTQYVRPYAFYEDSDGVGKTGIAVTVFIRERNRITGVTTYKVSGSSANEIGDGWYDYLISTADLDTYDYPTTFKTADSTVRSRNIPALWTRYGEQSTLSTGTLAGLNTLISSVVGSTLVNVGSFDVAALQQFFTTDTGLDYSNAIDQSIVKEIFDGIPPSSVGADAIWSYATRTLTMTLAQILNAVQGTDITLYRGDTNELTLIIGDISDYETLDIMFKNDLEDRDDKAVLHVRKNLSGVDDGLITLQSNYGIVIDPTWASVTINNLVTGNITMTLKADAAQYLQTDVELWYDIQKISATTVKTKVKGKGHVEADVMRGIS